MAPFFILTCNADTEDDTVLRVAAATNFERAMTGLEREFEAQSGYDVQVSYGSSGKLYAQIRAGAPFDVFLSADQHRADALQDIASGPAFIYAYGTLVLWAKDDRLAYNREKVLEKGRFRKIAMANPDLAPYGYAAMQVIANLGLQDNLKDKIVTGENVGQTYALVATGNAELGFIANTYLNTAGGTSWLIPPDLYTPIAQKAVQITETKAADAFTEYLQSEPAKAIIRARGYDSP